MRAHGFDFIGRYRAWFALSLALTVLSLGSLAFHGLNLGVDFTGGTGLTLTFQEPVTTGEVRSVLSQFGYGSASVRVDVGDPRQAFVKLPFLTPEQEQAVLEALGGDVAPLADSSSDKVSPIIGRELVLNALWALAIASVLIVAYLSYRFDYRMAVSAIVALLHDALIAMGVVSLVGVEVDAPFVAAILTIIGYSVNDTVIVFDRVREILKARPKDAGDADIANRAVWETLQRSINTALTTLLAVAAIYLFGGRTTRDFALTLLVGVTLGAYSSIFVAGPLWVLWRRRDATRKRTGPGSAGVPARGRRVPGPATR